MKSLVWRDRPGDRQGGGTTSGRYGRRLVLLSLLAAAVASTTGVSDGTDNLPSGDMDESRRKDGGSSRCRMTDGGEIVAAPWREVDRRVTRALKQLLSSSSSSSTRALRCRVAILTVLVQRSWLLLLLLLELVPLSVVATGSAIFRLVAAAICKRNGRGPAVSPRGLRRLVYAGFLMGVGG